MKSLFSLASRNSRGILSTAIFRLLTSSDDGVLGNVACGNEDSEVNDYKCC